jgi:uncharacterized protein (TIGR03382 family)
MFRRRAVPLLVASLGLTVSSSALADDARSCTYPSDGSDADPHRDDRIGIALIDSKMQNGRLATSDGNPSTTCNAPETAPPIVSTNLTHFYTDIRFHNYASVAACISVTVYPDATGTSPHPFASYQVIAYANTFDPSNLRANYLGAVHNTPDVASFSFMAAGNSDFEVVVNGDYPGNEYGLFVGGCGAPETQGAADGTAKIQSGELLLAPIDAGSTSGTTHPQRVDLSVASPDPDQSEEAAGKVLTYEYPNEGFNDLGCNSSGSSGSGITALLGALALLAVRRRSHAR